MLHDPESCHNELKLHTEWTSALEEMGQVSEMVQIAEKGAPKLSVRTLARMSSDPDADLATQRALHPFMMLSNQACVILAWSSCSLYSSSSLLIFIVWPHRPCLSGARREKERDEIWRQAQAMRRKVVNLIPARTEAELNAMWNKPQAEDVSSFNGALNESHRLWVLSTDLLEESHTCPWSSVGTLSSCRDDAKLLVKFMQAQGCKPFDMLLCFDGRYWATGNS